MESSPKDQASGAFPELKGRVTKAVGKATGDHRSQAGGQHEKVGGKVQKKVGQVETDFGK